MPEMVVRTAAKWLSIKWEAQGPGPVESVRPGRSGTALQFVSLGDLLAEEQEETQWLVEGRLPAGGLSTIISKPKVGKSTLARSLALAVSRGEPWLGWRTSQGAVFYLALEEKRAEVREHFRAMGATGDEPLRILFGPAPAGAVAQLEAAAEEECPALIIVDTLQQLLHVKDLNDYAQAQRPWSRSSESPEPRDPICCSATTLGRVASLLTVTVCWAAPPSWEGWTRPSSSGETSAAGACGPPSATGTTWRRRSSTWWSLAACRAWRESDPNSRGGGWRKRSSQPSGMRRIPSQSRSLARAFRVAPSTNASRCAASCSAVL
jgi:hypothetical protein